MNSELLKEKECPDINFQILLRKAIVIGVAQLELFKDGHDGPWVVDEVAGVMVVEVFITMFIVWGMPKLTTAFPSSLAGSYMSDLETFR